ncbi:unnamed protein product [Leptidea sinapis]|uniref:FLYWCH-type domain-containing protein n=1 Tax=Leptidea sinapis TaxID=189913 RepID=A0A5E4Q0Q6_9NEOP|nr:unnamed protein product [Leptidea sinapis]
MMAETDLKRIAEWTEVTKNGGVIVLYSGYQYTKKRYNKDGSIVWECRNRKLIKCTGSIKTLIIYCTSYSIVLYVKNVSGQSIAVHNGFTFWCDARKLKKNTWSCSNKHCKAKFFTRKNDGAFVQSTGDHNHPALIYVRNKVGNPVAVLNGYTFWCDKRQISNDVWVCSKRNCRAKFTTFKYDGTIIRFNVDHNHLPPNFRICNGFSSLPLLTTKHSGVTTLNAKFIQYRIVRTSYVEDSLGRRIALLGGYSFCRQSTKSKTKIFWKCSKHKICKARFSTNIETGEITSMNTEHNHPPPNFIMATGKLLLSYVEDSLGRRIALLGGYSFCRRSTKSIYVVTNTAGKKLAIIEGYTFYPTAKENSISWRCTRGFPCKARFNTRTNLELKKGYYNHVHAPPKFCISNGVYYKLK